MSVRVVTPTISTVPCIVVFPLSVSTVNLLLFELFCILNILLSALIVTLSWNVAPASTFKVESKSTAEFTFSKPAITVLPLSLSTVNLSTDPFVWILNILLSALSVTLSWNVAPPSTFNVVSRSTAEFTFNSPDITVLPLSVSTVNLSAAAAV